MKLIKSFLVSRERRQERKFLEKLPIFGGLTYNDITHLMGVLEERTYLKDEVLFAEGDIGRALFIVISGSVTLVKADKPLAEVKPGEKFGEMALLEEMPRSAAAKAVEKTQVYLLYKNRLDALIYKHPHIAVVILHYLARTLSARLRSMIEGK
ncbi:MAG: cyclic nucleotide-binding domain-containing protein [Elusimicrobia bacterium]|nr:cyclic nucleotide-binding domain-containing protein [Elusimicrobiota bacterium]